jgi:hypothetical protein
MRQQRNGSEEGDRKKRVNFEDNLKREYCGQAPSGENFVTE